MQAARIGENKVKRTKQHSGLKVEVPLTPKQAEAVEALVKTGEFTRDEAASLVRRLISEISNELRKG